MQFRLSAVSELDDLPLGMFGDLDLARYVPHPTQYIRLPNYPVVMQRGCPYPCSFCEAHVALGKKLRLLSPERVIEELKILKYEKGARGIYFQDSTFTINRKYITEIFERMIKEGLNDLLWSCTTRTDRVDPDLLALMHEAGCRNILYGIESANESSLQVIKKGITAERQAEAVGWTHKAKITMRFKGREIAHQEFGMQMLERIRTDLEGDAVVEQMPKLEGRQLVMVLAPKKK